MNSITPPPTTTPGTNPSNTKYPITQRAELRLTRGLVLLVPELGDQFELIADAHVGHELVVLVDEAQQLQALARLRLLVHLSQVLVGIGDVPLTDRQKQDRKSFSET